MSFPYKTILVIGATSGIGLALSERFIKNGIHVVAVGRRQEKLDELVSKHGEGKVSGYQFDVTKLDEIPSFVERITTHHPNLDSILLNSGIQRRVDFRDAKSIDLKTVTEEFTTNYFSHFHLTVAFLPFLQQAQSGRRETSVIYTTSGLALEPIVRCPNYCASKAAMHHLILVLRSQLQGSNVKIIEILPPAVQTELHDAKHQPDIKDGGNLGMPLGEFTDEAWEGLVAGKTDIPVGRAKVAYESWEQERQKGFQKMVDMGAGAL